MQNTDTQPFTLSQRTIFGLLAHNLFGAAYTPAPEVDWPSVYRESEYQAVRLQTFSNHQTIPTISPELRERIKHYLMGAMLRDSRIHAQHTYVHDLLTKNGISYTVLKGASSACYYPNPLTRAMGDVDFYVDPADIPTALAIFQAEGFEASEMDHICHIVLKKGQIHLEMHFSPPGVPNGAVGEIIRGYLSDLRESSTELQNPLVTCRIPSPFHHGLIMLMHLQHHLLSEGIGLRHLCDWAVFVNRLAEESFAPLFRERLKRVGLWRFARLLSLTAVLYVGLPEQAWMRESDSDGDMAALLMKDILAGGNFGAKDRQRAYEGLFISNRGKDGVGRNRIAEGFRALNQITYQKWPLTRKVPLLLPIGWVVSWVGYLFRNAKRNKTKGRVSAVSAYRRSAPRQKFYRRLELYRPEP